MIHPVRRLPSVVSCFLPRAGSTPSRSLAYAWFVVGVALICGASPAAAAPSVPTGLAASAVAGTSFTLTWSASTGSPTGYEVLKNTVAIGSTSGSPLPTTFNVGSLTPNTTYSMTVASKNASGSSAASTPLSVTTGPVTPTNLSATNKTATSFTLTWTGSTGATSYEIFRNGTSIGSTPTGSPPATTFNVTGLTANTAYTMTVKAKSSATTPSDPSVTLVVTTAPVAPTNLSTTNKTATSFTLNWTGSSGAVSYEIFRNGTSIGSTPTGSPPATTFNVTGLTANTAYSMTVKAKNAENTVSDPSTALSVTTSAAANQLPTVTLTAPAANAVLTLSGSISLAATASDPDGSVAKVEFFDGANRLGQATSSPFTFAWNPTVPGAKSLTARATDNSGGSRDSAAVPIRLLPSPPFIARFETSEGYQAGPLNGQSGWSVTGGSADVVTTTAVAGGTQSVRLGTGATATEVREDFGSRSSNPLIVFVDFFAKPVAGIDFTTGTLIDVETAQVAFVKSGSAGQFAALDGDGLGAGTWRNLGPAFVLNSSNTTTDWERVSLRLNYTARAYDLYINSQLAGADLRFRNNATFFSRFSLKGHTTANVALDDIYVGVDNPIFTDTDKDGIDDAWEAAHGLNPAVNDRNLDPDGDGLSNIQEYRYGTDPNLADTDGDGVNDNLEIASGTNPLVINGGPAILPGLRLWLKADAGVTSSANGVSAWSNQAAASIIATQSQIDARPALVPTAINHRPTLRFDGQNDKLVLNGFMNGANSGEVFVATRLANFSRQYNGLLQFDTGEGTVYGNGEFWDEFGTNNHSSYQFDTSSLVQTHVYNSAISTAGISTLRINGLVKGQRVGQQVSFPTDNLLIGNDWNSEGYHGDIAEILVFDHVLSEADRETVNRYLAGKYIVSGIPVPPKPTLTLFPVSSSKVALSWNPPADLHTVTTIERKTGNGAFVTLATVYDTSSYIDSGVTSGQTYTYRVAVRSLTGSSPSSDPATIAVPNLPDFPTADLRLWLNASVGTQGPGPLPRWRDQSGLGNDAIQNEPDRQPTVILNQVNGLPVVHFSQGMSNWMLLKEQFLSGLTGGEAFAVLRRSTTENVVGLWALGDATGSRYPEGDGQIYDDFATTSRIPTGPAPARLTDFHIYNVGGDNATWFQRFNGKVHFSQEGNTVGFRGDPVLGDGSGCNFDGDIAELLIYSRVLSAAERDAVGLYLATKYAPPAIIIPQKPSLLATSVGGTMVDLRWSEPASAGIHTVATIERKTGAGSFTPLQQVRDNSSYTDTGLTPGETYTYRLKLTSWRGASPYSDETTLTQPSIPAPLQTGLRLWLRAVVGNAGPGPLSQWISQTNPLQSASQPEGDQRPTVVANQINGLPVVHFDQTQNQWLKLPDGLMSGAAGGEAFAVLRRSTITNVVGLWAFGRFNGSRYPEGDGYIFDDFATNGWPRTGTAPTDLGQFHIYNVGGDGTAWFQRFNGATLYQQSGNTVEFGDNPVLGGGSRGEGHGPTFDGDIAEILVYDHVLSDADRDMIGRYLTQKYAPPAIIIPQKPTLIATSIGGQIVDLNWSESSSSAIWTTATIERKTGSGSFAIIKEVSDATSYTDTGLTPGETYTYRLKLTSWRGASPYSDGVTIIQPTLPPLPQDGLRLWLRATAGVTSGARVSRWINQIDPGHDATQTEADRRPTIIADQIHGLPVVHFTQSQYQWLEVSSGVMAGAIAGEAFAVLRRSSTSQVVGLWSFGTGPGSRYPESTGEMMDDFATNTWRSTGPAPNNLTDLHIYNVGGNSAEWFQVFNGKPHFRQTSNLVGFRENPRIGDGEWCAFDGDIAEVLVYDHTLNSDERAVLNQYLGQKYAITIYVVDSVAPTVPTGLAATGVTQSSFTLSWNASSDNVGVTEYEIYQNGLLRGSSATTSYNASGLSPSTSYNMSVKAKDGAGNLSGFSAVLPVTTAALVDTQAPSVPRGLTKSNVTSTSFTLVWTPSSDNVGVVGYDIFKDGSFVASSNVASSTINDLTGATSYSMTVRAKDAAGNLSAASAPLLVTTAPVPDTTAPSAPAGLVAANIGAVSLTLKWAPSTDNIGVVSYDVYSGGVLAGSIPAPPFDFATLTAATRYSFTVRAKDQAGNISGASQALSVVTQAIPVPSDGLRLWLEANAGVTADSSGRINTWINQAGLGSASQTNISFRPTLIAAGLNDQPVVHFERTGQYFDLPNAMASAPAGDAFIVLRASSVLAQGDNRALWQFGGGEFVYYPKTDGKIEESFGSNKTQSIGIPPVAIDNYFLYNVSGRPGEFAVRFNGILNFLTVDNTPRFSGTLALGKNTHTFGTNYFAGDIAEVIIYNRALNPQERETVGAYLCTKYALFDVPPAPSNLTVTAISSHQINVHWQAASRDNLVYYIIERSTGGMPFVQAGVVTNTLNFIDTDLAPGSNYSYRVKARSLTGISGYSDPASGSTFQGGTAMPQTGIRLWLDAESIAASTGSKVGIWADKSGALNNAEQRSAERPTLVAAAVNGKPAVHFEVGQYFNLPGSMMSGAVAGEVFAVVRASSKLAQGDNRALWQLGGGEFVYYPKVNGEVHESFGSTASKFIGTPPDISSFCLYNVSARDGEFSVRFNGVLTFLAADNQVAFNSSPALGKNSHRFGTNYFSGDIAEVVIYDRALTPQEREAVNFYLNTKYALTTPQDFEHFRDTNRDGLPDYLDILLGLDPFSDDVDGDGITNLAELTKGSDPLDSDTDADGVPDGVDYYPRDASRWQAPPFVPGDSSPPVLILTTPSTAVSLP